MLDSLYTVNTLNLRMRDHTKYLNLRNEYPSDD